MPCKLKTFFLFLDLSLYLSFFSSTRNEMRRQWEFARENIGLRKGGHQLYSSTVL
jgi:hypothetical protein